MNDWYPYIVGSYEKKFYDIRLHTGFVVDHCWPNAGMFISDIGDFAEHLVEAVKVSEEQ